MRLASRRWSRMLMAAVMLVPTALSAAVLTIYNALTRQYRSHASTLLPLAGTPTGQASRDHIQLVNSVESQSSAIHPPTTPVKVQASTAQFMTSTVAHPNAQPVRNLGELLPSTNVDQRTGSQLVSANHSTGETTGPTTTSRSSQGSAGSSESKSSGYTTPTTESKSSGYTTPTTESKSSGYTTPTTESKSSGYTTPTTESRSSGYTTPTTESRSSGGTGSQSTTTQSQVSEQEAAAAKQLQQEEQYLQSLQATKQQQQQREQQYLKSLTSEQAAKQLQQEEQYLQSLQATKQQQEQQQQQQQLEQFLQSLAAAQSKQHQQESQLLQQLLAAQAKQRQQQEQALQGQGASAAAKEQKLVDQYLQSVAAAKEQQLVKQYLEAVAAAKEQQLVEQYLQAVAAAKEQQLVKQYLEALASSKPEQTSPTTFARPTTRAESVAPVSASTGLVGVPMPPQYLHDAQVDQGVDYAAPEGTPVYAMGPGTIIGAGISGLGSEAPILHITEGPLAGQTVYYGSAINQVAVGGHVNEGQQIGVVGAPSGGAMTASHLEVGFYPPGPMGSGSTMLNYINSLVGWNTGEHTPMQTVNTSMTPSSSSPAATPVSASGVINDPTDFAVALLNALGDPLTSQNIEALVSWERAEGGAWNSPASFNPLNTTRAMSGSHAINSVGVQAYTSWSQGLTATVGTLEDGRYSGILAALKAGNSAQAVEQAVAASPWGTGPFALIA